MSYAIVLSCAAVNCSAPPARPAAGTWEWSGSLQYLTTITYTCGPYGRFLSEDGQNYEIQVDGDEILIKYGLIKCPSRPWLILCGWW